jgi:hypothetical protein
MAHCDISVAPRSPYPGPRPFTQDDFRFFFGRDEEIADLTNLVATYRTVVLYAQSGSGKTSIIDAGVTPIINKQYRIIRVRVGGAAPPGIQAKEIDNIYVFNCLAGVFDKSKPETLFQAPFSDLTQNTSRDDTALIIFDQFEELFTTYPERWRDRQAFFEQIERTCQSSTDFRMLFSIREEHLSKLVGFARYVPNEFRIRYHLERLRKEAANDAITKPMALTNLSFRAEAAEFLVGELLKERHQTGPGIEDVEGEFVEPIHLQIVCQNLWENLKEVRSGDISRKQVEDFGSVDDALESFYNAAVKFAVDQSRVRESKLRKWVQNKLITSARTRNAVFRGRQSTEGISNNAVDALEKRHVIRAERRAAGTWYELTHDRFLGPIDRSNATRERRRSKWRRALIGTIIGVVIVIWVFVFYQQQNRLGNLESYTRASLRAYEQFARRNFQGAMEFADKCIESFGDEARADQERLMSTRAPVPPVGAVSRAESHRIERNGLLNSVGSCYYVKGTAAEALHLYEVAREAYGAAAKLTYARNWDPAGWFWSQSDAASDKLRGMKR